MLEIDPHSDAVAHVCHIKVQVVKGLDGTRGPTSVMHFSRCKNKTFMHVQGAQGREVLLHFDFILIAPCKVQADFCHA